MAQQTPHAEAGFELGLSWSFYSRLYSNFSHDAAQNVARCVSNLLPFCQSLSLAAKHFNRAVTTKMAAHSLLGPKLFWNISANWDELTEKPSVLEFLLSALCFQLSLLRPLFLTLRCGPSVINPPLWALCYKPFAVVPCFQPSALLSGFDVSHSRHPHLPSLFSS